MRSTTSSSKARRWAGLVRVLSICDPGGVSEFYRTLTPYRLLAEAGAIELVADDGLSPAVIDHLHEFDAVVFSRADSAEHSLILAHAKLAGVRVVLDIDDNLFLLPPSLGVYQAWHERGTGRVEPRLYYLKKNIKLADVLTVSTEAMGRQLCDGEPMRLRQPGDYLVLPNQVLAGEWDVAPAPKPDGEIWVGWWGIYHHWDDWRDIAPYIEPVILARPQVRLVVLGMPEVGHLFPRLRANGQIVTGPFVAPDQLADYRRLVKAFDVGLAPTSACPFNESKSDLKVLQYGAAGLPVIASGTTYGAWRQEAMVLDSLELWGVALETMLDQVDTARQLGRQLQQKVLAERTYEANYERWLAALEGRWTISINSSSRPAGSASARATATSGGCASRLRKRRPAAIRPTG